MRTGEYIATLARKAGLSQSDIARDCGMSRQTFNYIISGKRELTLPQAMRLESFFSLKEGELVRMQDGERIAAYKSNLRQTLVKALCAVNAFWSYGDIGSEDIGDADLIEKTFVHLDMAEIAMLFELFPQKTVQKAWEDRLAGQGEYLHVLNMMIAQYYFNIKDPENFLKKMERRQMRRATNA